MSPRGQTARLRCGVLLLTLASFGLSACGGTGSEFAGGGTGGTGISSGPITGFGSVVVNGVHFRTDDNVAPGFVTKKMFNGMDNTSKKDRDLFRVGMVVTVRHAPDNNAVEIEYRDNLEGPVAAKSAGTVNTFTVLGQIVVVDDAAVFASLNRNDVVEVSGFGDAAGRIRATYIERKQQSPHSGDEFEVKGFVSGLSSSGFRIGPLPDGSGSTVTVSYDAAAISRLPGGPANGMYVQVTTTDTEPAGGSVTATRVEKLVARTDFPEKTMADLEGLVTTPRSGSGSILSFAVEGKRVQTDTNTEFAGGTAADIQPDARLQVQGTETGGILAAARIIFR